MIVHLSVYPPCDFLVSHEVPKTTVAPKRTTAAKKKTAVAKRRRTNVSSSVESEDSNEENYEASMNDAASDDG